MRKKRKRKNKKALNRRRQILKFSGAVFLLVIAFTLVTGACSDGIGTVKQEEVRGVWISYGDFDDLGLYNQDEEGFRENAEAFYDKAEEYGINTVFFHVRAFRDAAYQSEYFPAAEYLWDRPEDIGYDALEIMIELARDHDMELHAWLNPYRNTSFEEDILDPADPASTDEILLCVNEILDNYDVDGIHFDDYFYEEGSVIDDSVKQENVNAMVRAVYEAVHSSGKDAVFGISPAGNVSYCESIGADVETWLSGEGYVDYIVPQIYWTDQHTAQWREDMFTDTLNEWVSMNSCGADMYIGLALYKTGTVEDTDPGWQNSAENMCIQMDQIREKGCGGFVFFSASDFYREGAAEELMNYRELVF